MARTASPPLPPADTAHPDDAAPAPRHRSGAVAHMLGMPVATLRVWERRYGVTQPALSPSGQRLYSAADVQRLALLKRLTDLGHAIGSLARLDMAQLQQVADTHAGAAETAAPRLVPPAPLLAVAQARAAGAALIDTTAPSRPWRLAVVGPLLAARLQRRALQQALSTPAGPAELVASFADLAALAAPPAPPDDVVDALLLHLPRLHADTPAALQAALRSAPPALRAAPCVVLYRFGPESVCTALAAQGVALLREPQPDVTLGPWLRGLLQAAAVAPASTAAALPAEDDAPVPPRRWDDATLAAVAGASPTLACECPRHVAELLMQLSHFEAYSAECLNLDPADAELHAYLQRVAAGARARFEAALERVARHEGLPLPAAS
jgi:DNA-binding transcriptional MerR regulator